MPFSQMQTSAQRSVMREESPMDAVYGGYEEENSLVRSRREEKPGGEKYLNMTHYSRAEDHFGEQSRA